MDVSESRITVNDAHEIPHPLVPVPCAAQSEDISQYAADIADKSPNDRYIRSNDVISGSIGGILCSYKAFDSNNGVEIAWHKLNLANLDILDQQELTNCTEVIKSLDNDYLIRYLDTWYSDSNQTLNIITTHLESLKEFISKVKTLR